MAAVTICSDFGAQENKICHCRICHILSPVRMAIIKICTNSKYWRAYGEKGTLLYCWWEYKLI